MCMPATTINHKLATSRKRRWSRTLNTAQRWPDQCNSRWITRIYSGTDCRSVKWYRWKLGPAHATTQSSAQVQNVYKLLHHCGKGGWNRNVQPNSRKRTWDPHKNIRHDSKTYITLRNIDLRQTSKFTYFSIAMAIYYNLFCCDGTRIWPEKQYLYWYNSRQ